MKNQENPNSIYAVPQIVNNLNECHFYHVMDIPGYGVVGQGENGEKWDLRQGVNEYLGGVDFIGKRVLELGTASGFLCFHMEKEGAEVIAYDLSEEQEWDIVPFSQYDYKNHIKNYKEIIKKLNNGFWLAHRAFNSKAKVVYGSIYDVPEEIGEVDISTFCAILLHVRDPFLALQRSLRLTKETVIVTEAVPPKPLLYTYQSLRDFVISSKRWVFRQLKNNPVRNEPYMEFLPNFRTLDHKEHWWYFSPEVIVNFLGVLGFENTQVTYHKQKRGDSYNNMFTVVGKRTRSIETA